MQHGGCGKLPSRGSRSDYFYLPRHCDGQLSGEQMEAASEICGDKIPMICGEDVKEDDKEMQERRAIELALGMLSFLF